jgi:hypothetical protein
MVTMCLRLSPRGGRMKALTVLLALVLGAVVVTTCLTPHYGKCHRTTEGTVCVLEGYSWR